MIYCVEVLAIYELPGVTPTGARTTQRDNDLALAIQRADAVGKAVAPQSNEYAEAFSNRYGFGWRLKQWISVGSDADTVGQAVWSRLSTRSLKDGSKVEIFPLDETQLPSYVTGQVTFGRYLPTGHDVG